MYKVFVNNSVIILSTDFRISKDYTSIHIEQANLKTIIKQLVKNPECKFHLYHETEEKLFKKLFKKIPVVVAGGGKVYNENRDILFIFRNGKWDLPKGKIEKEESIAQCAIREVEEETGIENLEITRFLQRTFHVFKRDGEYRLKLTYWFEMYSEYKGKFTPQAKEGIEKAKWKSFKKSKKALKKTYGAIEQLFPMEYFDKIK